MKLAKICAVLIVIFITMGMCSADELTASLISKRKIQHLPMAEQAQCTKDTFDNQEIPDNTELDAPPEEIPIYFKPYEAQKGEVIFSSAKGWINIINPNVWNNKPGSGFPGYRGANQLIIYTPDFGERTNTNEFGAEAIVEGNTVVELSGADSTIPKDGFVISGHGRAKSWINSSLAIGSKIFIDRDTNFIYAYTTSESYIFETEKKISEAEGMISYYKAITPNYNSKVPQSYINDARDYLKDAKKHPDNVQKYSQLAIEAANDSLKSVLPYKNGELKGIWIRPTEADEKEITTILNRIKQAGIDNIFLETYFHGKTIYPSKVMEEYGFVPQYEKFSNLDVLDCWIKEAHKRNIKVHTWFETFYVGNENPRSNPQSILAVHPEWANRTKRDIESNNISRSASEHNGYFLDPANPEVQEFITKLIEEIITTYKPDGINVDYIRYPNSVGNNDNSNWGYTDIAINDFYMIYGVDLAGIKRTDDEWKDWCDYRREQVTNMIKKIGQLGKQHNTYISAVIFPDRQAAYNTKYQDWKTWSTRNFINGFTPLFLTCEPNTAKKMMSDVVKAKGYNTDFYAGLFVTFMGGSDEDLIRQIHEARKLNAKGVILFDYAHLSNRYIDTLSTSVFASADAKRYNTIDQTHKSRRLFGGR